MKLNWTVYLVRCADDSLYCGITNNVLKRIETHNKGKGAKYITKSRRPVKLVYKEEFDDKGKALSREAGIKKLSKTTKESLIKDFQYLEKEDIL